MSHEKAEKKLFFLFFVLHFSVLYITGNLVQTIHSPSLYTSILLILAQME